jgi:hypothetical protein
LAARSRTNKKLGARRGWHHINFGDSPWTHSFETDFGTIDNKIPSIIDWIEENVFPEKLCSPSLPRWLTEHLPVTPVLGLMPETVAVELLELILSPLIRVPSFKNIRIKQPLSWGLPEDERLGTAEIKRYYDSARSVLRHSHPGFFLFIYSPKLPFVYGDGLLDNLTPSLLAGGLRGYCLVPLTPRICVFYTSSVEGVYSKKAACIHSDPKMVETINKITEIYSRDVLFCPSQGAGTAVQIWGEHFQLDGHRNLLVDDFLSGSYFR